MANTQGINRTEWLKQAAAWALGVAAAIVPLYFVLQNDRDLQRTELGIADQHTAYTDVLNAADEVIVPRYSFWLHARGMGGEANLSEEQTAEIAERMYLRFPDETETTRAFEEAATRLLLVIPADDAHLISGLAETLHTSSVTSEGVELTPDDRLNNYTAAKLSLVNEFRSDVLGQDHLPDSEAAQMNAQTMENIKWEFLFRASNPRVPPTSSPGEALGLIQEPAEGQP